MTHDARIQREAAVAAEIQRLREYAESAAHLPVDIRFEHMTLDEGLAFVTHNGNDSPPLQTVARVAWYADRHLVGDREVGDPYPVIEELQVWVAVDGPGLPMRDITWLLGDDTIGEIRGEVEASLEARLAQRRAA